MKPYFSIVMTVYNNEKYMPIAVNSIKNQTFGDWELIIIDDGSTDNTPNVIDEIAKSDRRIRAIHQDNQWIYNSFNNGIAAAQGKYVFIVNSDDTINPQSLEKIHDVAEIDGADIVMFNLVVHDCDENQNIIRRDVDGWSNKMEHDFSYHDRETIHLEWCEFIEKTFLRRQCVYKTEIAKRIKYRTDIYGGDYYYNYQIADSVNAAAGTSYLVYNFFQYNNKSMNASVGKYYGYEHSMFNEFFMDYKNLFIKWNVYNDRAQDILCRQRIQKVSAELRSYLVGSCSLSIDEKLEKIFTELSDGIAYDCACKLNRGEEYQSRILSGLRELFLQDIPSANGRYYFVYEMLESLLRYEKDDEDLEKIRSAVYNTLNPQRIGECFYNKILKSQEEPK